MIPNLKITMARKIKTTQGCLGKMEFNGKIYYTIERPDLNNIESISCIPAGTYQVWFEGGKIKNLKAGIEGAYIIQNVPRRSNIEIHIANYPGDVKGCIGIGLGYNGMMVTDSVKAVKQFYKDMDNLHGLNEFTLEIVEE